MLPLYGAGFVTAFGAHAVAASLGVFSARHGASLLDLGILLALYDGAEIVLKPVFGTLADRVGAKPVLLGGLIAFALASAAFVLAGAPQLVGVARLAQGSAAAAFSPAAGAMVATLGGARARGRAFGGYGGAKSLGYLLGPLVGGLLVAGGGYGLLFTTIAALALVVAGAVAIAVPATPPTPRPRATARSLAAQIARPEFLAPVLLLAAGTAALSSGVGFLPLLGADRHLSTIATGALVSLLAATTVVVSPWAGRQLDRGRFTPSTGAAALLLAAAGFLVAALAPGAAGIAAGAVLIGIGVAVSTPLGFATLAAGAPPGRLGQTMGSGEVGRELGDAGGPLIVAAAGVAGLTAGLGALAGAIVVAALASRRLVARTPSPEGERRSTRP